MTQQVHFGCSAEDQASCFWMLPGFYTNAALLLNAAAQSPVHNLLSEMVLPCTGARDHELAVLPCNGLVPRRSAVPDRAPPVPSYVPPQSQSGLAIRAAGLPRAGAALPLPHILPGFCSSDYKSAMCLSNRVLTNNPFAQILSGHRCSEREIYFKSHISLWEHSSHVRLIGRGVPSVSVVSPLMYKFLCWPPPRKIPRSPCERPGVEPPTSCIP